MALAVGFDPMRWGSKGGGSGLDGGSARADLNKLFQHLGNIKAAKSSYFTLKVIREYFGWTCHCSWDLMARILGSVRCKDNISVNFTPEISVFRVPSL